jgi:hypothetical protein
LGWDGQFEVLLSEEHLFNSSPWIHSQSGCAGWTTGLDRKGAKSSNHRPIIGA